MNFDIEDNLKKLGLNEAECSALGLVDGMQYLRFYHVKEWGKSSIVFVGFADNELNNLLETAAINHLKVYKQILKYLNFACISETANSSAIAKTNDLLALSKSDFRSLFELEYKLLENSLLYDRAIPDEFRIAKPLSNFDKEITVNSFSQSTDNSYLVNLYHATCNCAEFVTSRKDQYPRGDLRRLCKHLIHAYKYNFGVYKVSSLAKCVFNEEYALLPKFHYFKLSNSAFVAIVSFKDEKGWWDLYIPNKEGVYKKYGYSSIDKRFSYNSKPIGIVPELRNELLNFEKSLSYNTNPQFLINSIRTGCLLFIILTLLIVLMAVFLT